jgi:hypothetical protein
MLAQAPVLLVLVGSHFVFSCVLGCSVFAPACSFAAFTFCFFDNLMHDGLLVFCTIALYPVACSSSSSSSRKVSGESSLQVTKTTYGGPQEHRVMM